MKRNSEIVASSQFCRTNYMRFIQLVWFGLVRRLLAAFVNRGVSQTNGFYAFLNTVYVLNSRKPPQRPRSQEGFNFSSLKCGMNSDDNAATANACIQTIFTLLEHIQSGTFKWRGFLNRTAMKLMLVHVRGRNSFCFDA